MDPWIHETFGRTPWAGDQSSAKACTYTEQHNTQKDIHPSSGIRNHDTTVRVIEGHLHLRSAVFVC